VTTTCGDIVVRLDGAAAPRAVASFVELARSGYWQGSGCDRLTARLAESRVLQCGDAPGRVLTPPGYDLGPENVPPGHRYERGMVGMVTPHFHRASGGEFFFVYEDFTAGPETMGEPAIVGRVVSGMEVLDTVADAGVEDGVSDWHPFINVGVQSVSVSRGRASAP
jgi:peptidyl-prolyl cis-trans isomerase B (cyclophilin B)